MAVAPWSSGVEAAGTVSSRNTVTREEAAGIGNVPRASSAQGGWVSRAGWCNTICCGAGMGQQALVQGGLCSPVLTGLR